MSTLSQKAEVMQILADMITEVLGESDLGIDAETSFKDALGFQSIQFIALAELLQERYGEIDFVSWLSGMEVPQILALQVGDVADFITTASAM